MRRLCTALALGALLVLGSLWSDRAVSGVVDAVVSDIERGALGEAYGRWQASQTLLGALLVHDELSEVNRLFARLSHAPNDRSADRAELLENLRHLPGSQRPSLRNLL